MSLLPLQLAFQSCGKNKVDPEEMNAAEEKLQLMMQREYFHLDKQQLAQENKPVREVVLPFTCHTLDDPIALYTPLMKLGV